MRSLKTAAAAAALLIAANAAALAEVKQVPYPAVKVQLADAYKPDAAFERMQRALADAVARKDAQALFALVGPTFVWLSQGDVSNQFDFGGDALQNFKVVFGFREFKKYVDGAVSDGPYWDILATFAADKTHDVATDTLVCGPTDATISDDNAFESAKQKINAGDAVEWYFTLADTPATATPTGGAPIGRTGIVALPVLSTYPTAAAGQAPPPPTNLQVLLPTGKSGWIPISAALPLVTDRLCFAMTADGDWKIAGYDQAQ